MAARHVQLEHRETVRAAEEEVSGSACQHNQQQPGDLVQ